MGVKLIWTNPEPGPSPSGWTEAWIFGCARNGRSPVFTLNLRGRVVQSQRMIGTILNTAAILVGGFIGLTVAREISLRTQHLLKLLLGAFILYAGFTTTWNALNGSFGRVVKQLGIVVLSLLLGNVAGKLLRLQKGVNRLGQYAKERFARAQSDQPSDNRFSEGFVTCTLLFCVGPMAFLGALQDGLTGNFRILAIKSVLDGLSTMAFAKTFGWGVMLSAIPVLAYQGTVTLAATSLQPLLEGKDILDSINATGGLLVAFIALIVFEVKKVPLADYLPSLVFAPLLTLWWR
jgi:uncharacterized membrane protein YqgA involved in biofilm formation